MTFFMAASGFCLWSSDYAPLRERFGAIFMGKNVNISSEVKDSFNPRRTGQDYELTSGVITIKL